MIIETEVKNMIKTVELDMTVIVFNGDVRLCVLGNMEEIKRKLEDV